MLLGILAVLIAAAGVFLAWYLSQRDHTTQVTTLVTSAPATVTTTPVTTPSSSKVSVPSVVGLPEEQALRRLSAAGFTPKLVLQPSSQPSGTVVSQTPAAATEVAKGTTVRVVVSHAGSASTTAPTTTAAAAPPSPQTAQVPDVNGQTEAAAAQTLVSGGVLPSFVFVPSSQPLGTVVGQAKQSGSTVSYGAHMQVNLSQGPHTQGTATVPSAIGQSLTDAVSTLNGAQLRLIYAKLPVTSRAQAGKIVQQSPGAGASAPRNAQVLVLLGAYRG
jgi:serine/threonine-protein kinase